MSWVYELSFGVAIHRDTQISKLILLHYIDFFNIDTCIHVGKFYQNEKQQFTLQVLIRDMYVEVIKMVVLEGD